MRIYTIGHSNRTLDQFVTLLVEHGITRLADVRRYPGSRRNPHFSRQSLERLPLEYIHFEELGGHRSSERTPDPFRACAEHMTTPEFAAGIDRLLASDEPTAILCAEALPSNCHRSLLSEALVRRGVQVLHIIGPGELRIHGESDQKSLDFRGL
jgi:uncharacterized protein (DUF488 family)